MREAFVHNLLVNIYHELIKHHTKETAFPEYHHLNEVSQECVEENMF